MSSCELLYWRNPVETGKVFGGALVALLVLKKVNLITFMLRAFYTAMLTTASVEFLSKLFLGQGLVTRYGLQSCPDTVGFLKPRIDAFLTKYPSYQAEFRRVVMAQSPKRTFKAAGVFYVLHMVFSIMSLWTALFVGTIATFTLPVVYKTFQKEIDATVAQGVEAGKHHASALQSTVAEKTSPYVKQLDEKMGPVSGFIKSKLPATRVAGSNVTAESSTAKLAAQVPFEEPAVAKTSSADFPAAPSVRLDHAVSDIPTTTSVKLDHTVSDFPTTPSVKLDHAVSDFPSAPSTKVDHTTGITQELNEPFKQ
ncbi:LANO_0E10814g1_1 [Lachancea nothofagi CBS 11611]|uniref:Reticulon-like protein n=1 Tax=Lachancea nothofagi CBS 11611 TaxID=1266666 RepID=A0A1G4JX13_9SACH|nr:LANO_0E10814g1_1 [Lachancea nothofagi CBS 11611]